MYTAHFGLDEGPFHGNAEGREVYVGPQQAAVLARLRKALAIPDTVVTVSGPVGVGKTTLVRRAIAEIAGRKVVVPVDRMRLEPDEVLDLLLVRFDVSRQPKGTIQRVAAFRRLLQERLSTDTRIFIVVEDAQRVGIDALLELEALTATDSSNSGGANIVLMGSDELRELLAKPSLARLRQRIRLRQTVTPFDAAEVEGYMRHCLDAAGGVLEQILEPGTAEIVYRYSGGVARVVDNLCESVLVAAAEAGVATILPEFLQEVAENCGLEPLERDAAAETTDDVPAPSAKDVTARNDAAPGDCAIVETAERPVTDAAPPQLSLVEPLSGAEEETLADVAELTDSAEESSSDAQAVPAADGMPPAASPAPEEARRGERLTVSRIDEVLPELIERLQSAAKARVGTAPVDRHEKRREEPIREAVPPEPGSTPTESADAGNDTPVEASPSAANADDSVEIPTLSNSMRVAVLPAEKAGERPARVPETAETDGAEVGSAQEPEGARAAETPADDGISQPDETPEAGQSTGHDEAPQDAEPLSMAVQPAMQSTREAEDANAGIEPADFELMLAPDDGSADVEAAADPDMTTEAETLSLDDGLQLEPDAFPGIAIAENAENTGEPELDALQAAIQAANAWQAGEAAEADETESASRAESGVPAITLDRALDEPASAEKPASDFDRWADELSRAKSLEDISDMLAETLFGSEELQEISAQIRSNRPAQTPVAPAKPAPAPAKTAAARSAPQPPKNSPPESRPRPKPNTPSGPSKAGGMSLTMSQRIEMLNSLNKGKPAKRMPPSHVAEIVLADRPDAPSVTGGPAPIEAQIETAITQSRKALTEADLARLAAADDDDDKGSRGLFGLFRRSSKP